MAFSTNSQLSTHDRLSGTHTFRVLVHIQPPALATPSTAWTITVEGRMDRLPQP